MQLYKYNHCVVGANLHLTFTPAYRRNIFYDSVVKNMCYAIFQDVAHELTLEIKACAFCPEHVHLFVSRWKDYTIPTLAQRFKGRSSRVLRKYYWNRIKGKLWGKKFWTGGYFAETIGRVTSETIDHYIKRMQGKHWRTREDGEEFHEVFFPLPEEEQEDIHQLKLIEFSS